MGKPCRCRVSHETLPIYLIYVLNCSTPYLAAVCHHVLRDNGFSKDAFNIICTSSPETLKIGSECTSNVPNVCNCLVADLIDDGVLSAGLIPAVAHALEELLVRDDLVLVPQTLTVMAQAVEVRPSMVETGCWNACSSGSASGCGHGTGAGPSSPCTVQGAQQAPVMRSSHLVDLTALDQFRCQPSGVVAVLRHNSVPQCSLYDTR